MELVSLYYLWPQLWKYVKEFVGSCVCVRVKNPHHHPYELFQPLPIPSTPWSLISMDFIIDLPLPNSFDSISMVMGYLTNMAHFIPCNKSIISEGQPSYFLIMCFDIMVFLKISFLTMDLNFWHPSFGRGFWSY
jgi:hypothetical protein